MKRESKRRITPGAALDRLTPDPRSHLIGPLTRSAA